MKAKKKPLKLRKYYWVLVEEESSSILREWFYHKATALWHRDTILCSRLNYEPRKVVIKEA